MKADLFVKILPDKNPVRERFMFIDTQCDLWSRPDGTGHEKISRGNFPRLIFSLIPSLFEHPLIALSPDSTQISVKCDLAKNTSDEKSFEVMTAKSEQ